MQERKPLETIPTAMTQIGAGGGAFLTVQEGDDLNTMTIGWAVAGIMWGKQALGVAVRFSRYTFEIMERATEFTVSVPIDCMKDELTYCGTRSGRDEDKIAACKIKTRPGQITAVPVLDTPGLHYECRMLYRAPMALDRMFDGIMNRYPDPKDLHTHYYGEIVACYEL
jgi:flavin reductase (DIM6/NTAB) family NADH-FMN oxidoreductase RutF